MRRLRPFIAYGFLAVTLMMASPVSAGSDTLSTHGLSMHGALRYAADAKHLSYANPDAPKGGTLKLAKTGSFNSLNHHIINGTAAEGLEYINDKLMQRVWDEPFGLYGLVATSADISADRSEIIFHLDPAARFHDGKPMTADDVKFSFDSYKTYGHPVRRRVYGLVDKVDIIDSRTIRFHFGPGYDRESVMILAMMPVLPKHYWTTEGRDISKTTLTPPLGSGPYKIDSVEPGRKITYTRVKDYWAADKFMNRGLYNFDTLSYTYFRDDDVSLQAFIAGDYDLRREYDIGKWTSGYAMTAEKQKHILREEIAHGRPEWLRAFVFNTRRPLFADRRVREALSLMFDAEWINRNIFAGEMRRINSLYPNAELAATGKPVGAEREILEQYKADLPPEVFNDAYRAPDTSGRAEQKRAVELLKDAGYTFADQKLVDKNGQNFTFEILLDNPADEKIALAYARRLERIGVNVKIRTVDAAQFAGRLESFDYDMVSFKWINSLSPGNEQTNYWGAKAAHNPGSRNYAGIDNKAIDALADSIARTTDRVGLVARTRALDRAIMAGHYMVPLFYLGRDLVAHDVAVKRPEAVPVYGVVLETWWRDRPQ